MALADLLIITPLDEEWRQSRSVLKSKPNEIGIDAITYYLWSINSRKTKGAMYLVAAASMGKMGIGNAAGFSKTALEAWNPYCVSLLGIAGSLKPTEILLGDVVISEEVFGYELGEVTNKSEFSFRPTGHQSGVLLLDRARALRNDPVTYLRWQSACMKAAERENDPSLLARPPEVHFGVTASGNFVVKTAEFYEALRSRLHPKVCAVEMEAKGLFISVSQLENKAQPFVIRGISDYADEEKSNLEKESKDAWRRFASGNAARFLKYLMARDPFRPRSPQLKIKLIAAESPQLLLEHSLFLREKGATNLAFENIFGEQTESPSIELEVSAMATSSPVLPNRSLCLLGYEGYARKIEPYINDTGSLSVSIPRSTSKRSITLLLSFTNPVDKVLASCRDEFGREAFAEWL